jgi:hypothetical protein
MSSTTQKQIMDGLKELASLPYKKGPRVRAIEREFRQAKDLADQCKMIADTLYGEIHANLPTPELREMFQLFSLLNAARANTITQNVELYSSSVKRARRLVDSTQEPRKTKRAKKST